MAKYGRTKINGVEYELRPVQIEKKEAGFVPVILLKPGANIQETADGVQALLEDRIQGLDGELFCRLFRNGLAIHLQAKVRNAGSDKKATEEEIDAEIDKIPADELVKYVGKLTALRAEVRRRIEERKAEQGDALDAKKIWTEFA